MNDLSKVSSLVTKTIRSIKILDSDKVEQVLQIGDDNLIDLSMSSNTQKPTEPEEPSEPE